MLEDIKDLLKNHFVQGVLLTLLGLVVGWLLGRWRRYRLLRRIEGGDAREVVVIEKVLLRDHPDGRVTLRIRSCGSAPLKTVLINPVAHDAFLQRSLATTVTNPLIPMTDPMGSFLLYLLTPWVCGMTQSGPYAHDVWIMAPVCEPGLLSAHQSTTILLVRQAELKRFLDWDWCQALHTEHGSDGARILTLWHMAHEFERQLTEVKRLRDAGKPATYVETMYILDLALDTEEIALPTRPVPWERFASVLKELGLAGSPAVRA
jgi:hypothetical protein